MDCIFDGIIVGIISDVKVIGIKDFVEVGLLQNLVLDLQLLLLLLNTSQECIVDDLSEVANGFLDFSGLKLWTYLTQFSIPSQIISSLNI